MESRKLVGAGAQCANDTCGKYCAEPDILSDNDPTILVFVPTRSHAIESLFRG
jgi:hypothetical protein